MSHSERQLAHLNVIAEDSVIVPVRDFVSRLLATQGVPAEHLPRFELMIEEACLLVMQTAFDPGETGDFDIIVSRRPNQIVVAVEDRGLPCDFDQGAADAESQLGLVLMRAFADEVVFHTLGTGGKRIEVIKDLPAVSVEAQLAAEPVAAEAPSAATDAVRLRLMRGEDAVPLARCIYRSYGYTYDNDFVYFPSKVMELLESGRLVSCVAVNEGDEVIGHLALHISHDGDKVPESGVAVVDRRYRGRKLFEQMKRSMAAWARERGLYGLTSDVMVGHRSPQQANLALGAGETGILLGYHRPQGQTSGPGGREVRRPSLVMFYLPAGEAPERSVFLPAHHAGMLQQIYQAVALPRHAATPPPEAILGSVRAQRSVMELRVKPESNRAFIRLEAYGGDVVERIHRHLRDLCRRHFDCILLDVPLSQPLTAVLCRAFEALGFSFAGIGIEVYPEGDALRLFYLNNVEADSIESGGMSDHGQALAAYVIAAREAVQRRQQADL